jgi:hypothetical protein
MILKKRWFDITSSLFKVELGDQNNCNKAETPIGNMKTNTDNYYTVNRHDLILYNCYFTKVC